MSDLSKTPSHITSLRWCLGEWVHSFYKISINFKLGWKPTLWQEKSGSSNCFIFAKQLCFLSVTWEVFLTHVLLKYLSVTAKTVKRKRLSSHICNPSTWEAEAGGSGVPSQHSPPTETLSQNQATNHPIVVLVLRGQSWGRVYVGSSKELMASFFRPG